MPDPNQNDDFADDIFAQLRDLQNNADNADGGDGDLSAAADIASFTAPPVSPVPALATQQSLNVAVPSPIRVGGLNGGGLSQSQGPSAHQQHLQLIHNMQMQQTQLFVPTHVPPQARSPAPAAIIQDGKVVCPYCTGKSINLGGAARGVQYAYMCEKCGQRWNQNCKPDPITGDYNIKPSNRKIGEEPRRSGGYACGKCGAKPKFGHICPFKNIDPADAANFVTMAATAAFSSEIGGSSQLDSDGSSMHQLSDVASSRTTAVPNVAPVSAMLPPVPALVPNVAPLPTPVLPPVPAIVPPATTEPESVMKDAQADAVGERSAFVSVSSTDSLGLSSVDDNNSVDDDAIDDSPGANSDETGVPPVVQKTLSDMAKDGITLVRALALKRLKVKGDGSCWVYAILASAHLIDHANARVERVPSGLDRAKDLYCRMLVVTWLRNHGKASLNLNDNEIASINTFLKTPVHPLTAAEDYGTYGNNISIAGLVPYLKVTVVLWDKTSMKNSLARQQVIEYIGGASVVRERFWDTEQIATYCSSHDAIHIEWNGVNHYAALVPETPVAIDPEFDMALRSQSAVTRTAPVIRSMSSTTGGGWLDVHNGLRNDPTDVEIQTFAADTPVEILKVACMESTHNAILIFPDQNVVKFATFKFNVSVADCAETADFRCRSLYYNKHKKRSKAPPLNCMCGKYHKTQKRLLQCDGCERFCHQECTPLAGLSLDDLEKVDEYLCPDCLGLGARPAQSGAPASEK